MTTVRVTLYGSARADARRAYHCARASFNGADAVCTGFARGSVCPPEDDPNALTYTFRPRTQS